MGAIVCLLFVGDQFMAGWNRYINSNPKWIPFLMGMIRLFDRNVTPIDMVAKFLEVLRSLEDELIDRFGFFDAAIRNVYGPLHE
jgi:hypothetical protein